MKITLYLEPWAAPEIHVSLIGSVLTLNGSEYVLSVIPNGARVKHPLLGIETRLSCDNYECIIRFGHGPNAPHETRFPEPIVLESRNGPVGLPPYNFDSEVSGELAQ